ncbi:hypothetical protein JN09_001158 [Acholeplasma morum]|uniref:hypothetical protein n=1 Tax=Paracholeplasma morum TaxID=264637 RepID=UPI001958AD29|nr:hypothetical protein [Paracholeplasma morum]MBM7453825.1 hypothetical protein [Paracholeplasma morum]
MSEINNNNLVLEWNDSIENDGQEYILLPEGDYNFTVIDFERGRFNGSAKIPECNKAIITVQVESKEGISTIKFDLILYRSLEWRLSGFFRSIGQKKHGEKLVMDWSKVVGSKGRAHFKQRSYVNQNGEEKFVNDVDRFIDYNEDFFDDLPF